MKPVMRVVTITPELAQRWLSSRKSNRPVGRRNVELLARQMREGRWRLNGESIIFNGSQCIDGQHRLLAVVESGATIESVVVENVETDAFDTIDTGKARTAADVLALSGGIPNARDVASAARYIYHAEHGDPAQSQVLMPSNADVRDVVARHPDLISAASRISGLSTARRLLMPSVATYLYYMFAQVNNEDAERFFVLLDTGESLAATSPIYRLRERMQANRISKARLPRTEILAIAIKAWNAFRAGRSVTQLRWRRVGDASESFPEIGGRS